MPRLYRAADYESAAMSALRFAIRVRDRDQPARDENCPDGAAKLIAVRVRDEAGRVIGADVVYEESPDDGPVYGIRAFPEPSVPGSFLLWFVGEGFSGPIPCGWMGDADELM